ncbi:tellurite resistance domain protein [Klebsiella sp. BIGb0407]|uniref:tellurite resistance domain protein n=1 Tax=Klebsiella sp. BIGb0407 TaxID=2940603 RepID=UPI00216933FA|nr:tellurite resistance domain protein [Klebsiella sp. BIGb0407]MCS3431088.1 tellurite resistance protein TerA [Klebsiella sp. BIGb0407]
MQRLTTAAPIDDSTLAIYEETVAIIHRYLPPSLALLYASARRGAEGNLEWWTERQGLATPLDTLTESEQLSVQNKRQQYQNTLSGLIDQLASRGEDQAAQALRMLLTHSQGLTCYSVGGEPVLLNWAIPTQEIARPVVPIPWWRRLLPWLLLLLLLLILAFAWWWYRHHNSALPVQDAPPATASPVQPSSTQLTQDNPSVNIENRKDFGRIKVNLTWGKDAHKKSIDLDIAAFIRFKNREKDGVEALSNAFGHYEKSPYILLEEDLRNGNNQDGEWLFINGSQWQEIDEILIYSFIYDGTDNWQDTGATITIYIPDQPPIISALADRNETNNVAAIARLKNIDGDIKVERLDSFFPDRETLDKHFGWGFKWVPVANKK